MFYNAAAASDWDAYWGRLARESYEDDVRLYGLKAYDFEKPIPQNAGSISCSLTVTDPIQKSTCQVMARITPAENGMTGYMLDFVYDGSSACGKDGELVDTLAYIGVFDMYGTQLLPAGNLVRDACNANLTGAGRSAELAGFTVEPTTEKQVYALFALGYYELVVGGHRKRILFDNIQKNSFIKRLPRALFVVESSAAHSSQPNPSMLNQALERLEI